MSFLNKVVALSLLSGAMASDMGTAPIQMEMKPIMRRQAAGQVPIRFSPNSGFSVPVKIGAQQFNLVVSTQDADTWVVGEQVSCQPPPQQAQQQGQQGPPPALPCKFGARYKLPGTFAKMNGPVLEGAASSGVVGTETLTIGGITIPNQVIGLVTNTAGNDESVSGGLGLGSALQSDMGYAANQTRLNYAPVFANMIAQKLIKSPVASLSITNGGGVLAFGGLPAGANAASMATGPQAADGWVVKADGYALDGQVKPSALNLGLDLASPGTYLPKAIADAINGKIAGSKFRTTDGMYSVPCNVKSVGGAAIVIGGKQFPFNAADLVVPDMDVPNACVSLIGAFNSPTDGTLGVNFLKTVIVALDPVKKQLMFGSK